MLIPRQKYRHRKFGYEPRFYDPTKDENIRKRIRIKSKVRRGKHSNLIWTAMLLVMIFYFYRLL